MTEQPDLSTLPQRMRYAADVLGEADERYGSKHSWSPDGLEIYASKWEDQDCEAAELDTQIEELARKIYHVGFVVGMHNHRLAFEDYSGKEAIQRTAKRLIESGWRKGDPA